MPTAKLLGRLDRRLDQNKLHVDLKQPNTRLDILVENTGRINFSLAIRGERQGITKQVTLAGKELTGWQIYPLPDGGPRKAAIRKRRLHWALLLSRKSQGGSAR